MNSPESPNHEIENALLLEQSGELTDSERDSLRRTLGDRPELAAWVRESQILQNAGPSASSELTPPLPELSRERILKTATRPASKTLPRLLALAAMLILALGLLPHLSRHLQAPPPTLTTRIEPVQVDLQAEDPMLEDLEDIQNQLAAWSELPLEDTRILEDENDWAEILLSLEETI